MYYYISYRDDGTLSYLAECEEEWDTFPPDGNMGEVTEDIANFIKVDPEGCIVEGLVVRKRTETEMETRVREIYNKVKSGELHRVPNDLIDKYKHFFTLGELEEVELPEQKVKRMEARLKALETRLR